MIINWIIELENTASLWVCTGCVLCFGKLMSKREQGLSTLKHEFSEQTNPVATWWACAGGIWESWGALIVLNACCDKYCFWVYPALAYCWDSLEAAVPSGRATVKLFIVLYLQRHIGVVCSPRSVPLWQHHLTVICLTDSLCCMSICASHKSDSYFPNRIYCIHLFCD